MIQIYEYTDLMPFLVVSKLEHHEIQTHVINFLNSSIPRLEFSFYEKQIAQHGQYDFKKLLEFSTDLEEIHLRGV